MPLVVHPHFHRRRTGVTAHTELIVPALEPHAEARALGRHLSPDVPRITWRELWRRARAGEPVVWHAHRNNEMLAGLLLRLFGRRVRLVYTRHGSTVPSGLTGALARRAERLVTLNPQAAERMGLPSRIVTHGVDLARFSPPADRAQAWAALGQGGRHGIGVVGRVRPMKGQGDFAAAVAPLLDEAPDWRAVLVGLVKPAEAAWAQGLVASTGGRLVLAGEHRDVVPWYRGLSVLVHPSYAEAFSMVLVEAMASGCCPVVTRLPHVPGVVEHGRTGFMYEPGDVGALRELLRMLLREPERAHQVGRNAAEEARARFGVEHEARALAELYAEALGD